FSCREKGDILRCEALRRPARCTTPHARFKSRFFGVRWGSRIGEGDHGLGRLRCTRVRVGTVLAAREAREVRVDLCWAVELGRVNTNEHHWCTIREWKSPNLSTIA